MATLNKEPKIVREIDENKFKNIFLDGLNRDDEESIQDHFKKIEKEIISLIGNNDFLLRYKSAIVNFGDWFISEFKTKELDDFCFLDCELDMPLIMIIYFDIVKDNIYLESYGEWDKYINMYKTGLKRNIESKISQLAYVNAYYSLRCDSEKFVMKNIEPLVIFYKWFLEKHLDEKLEKAVVDNWNGEYPFIADVVSEYLEGEGEVTDEQANILFNELEEQYKNLSFSEKKNVDSLIEWIASIDTDKSVTICPVGHEPMEAIPFPKGLTPNNEETSEQYDLILKILRGYSAFLYEDDGVILVSRIINSHKQCFSGFLFYDRNVHVMDAMELAESISLSTTMDVEIIFDTPDIFFVN